MSAPHQPLPNAADISDSSALPIHAMFAADHVLTVNAFGFDRQGDGRGSTLSTTHACTSDERSLHDLNDYRSQRLEWNSNIAGVREHNGAS